MMSTFSSLFPSYEGITLSMLLMYVIAGMFGALVRIAWLDKPLRGMYRDRAGALKLGAWAEVIVGIAVAILVGGHPIRAGLSAVFAPAILNALQVGVVSSIKGRK